MQTTILNSIHFPVEGANLKFVKKKSKLNLPVYQYFWMDLQSFLYQQVYHFHVAHECSNDKCV